MDGDNNYFNLPEGIDAAGVLYDWDGTQVEVHGTLVNGRSRRHAVGRVDECNAEHDPDFGDVSREPEYVEKLHPSQAVSAQVGLRPATAGSAESSRVPGPGHFTDC